MNSDKPFKNQVSYSYPSINQQDDQKYHYRALKDQQRNQFQHQGSSNHLQANIVQNSKRQYRPLVQNNVNSDANQFVNNQLDYVNNQNQNQAPVLYTQPQMNYNQPQVNYNQNLPYNAFNQAFYKNQPPNVYMNNAPIPPRKIRTRITRQEAMMEGQFYTCPRCGYNGNGAIYYQSGKTACLWGIGLFIFTGIFCWIPCVCNGCKDISVYCGKCGYKKAIVLAQCC